MFYSSTQQHTLESPPNTLSAIKISRPSSQSIELTSLSDLDRGNERPDGAEQNDSGERRELYSPRNSNPVEKVRERTSSSSDYQCATTFGIDNDTPIHSSSDKPNGITDEKNRISGTSSAGISRTSRSSISGASLGAVEVSNCSSSRKKHAEEEGEDEREETEGGRERGKAWRSMTTRTVRTITMERT